MFKRKHSYSITWEWMMGVDDAFFGTLFYLIIGGIFLLIPAGVVGGLDRNSNVNLFHHVFWDVWFAVYLGIPILCWGTAGLVWLINNPPVTIERHERVEYQLTRMEKLEARTKALEKAADL